MANTFKSTLEELLKTDTRLTDENSELRGNLIRELANQLDEQLLELLLKHEATREKFFVKVKDVHVFRHNDFKFFLDENKIDNSYTQYENKIGLSVGGKLLRENADVVLNFPYKDCVLEGGQSTEEGMDAYFEEADGDYVEKQSKRKEIFFNEVLARDEIDRLFDPKAFTNITKYSANGTEKPTGFTRNTEGTITDNLLIKGNNLLALHSLKQEFKGKVKLIYIDPPYNTGSDSFKYNDNFNHSTWLTFMKNRLEIAKELLKSDGLILVHCDENEDAYLKVLMDGIFDRVNYISSIAIKSSTPSGVKTAHREKTIIKQKDSILVYRKSALATFNPQYVARDKWDQHFNYYLDRNKDLVYSLLKVLKENGILSEKQSINDFDLDNPEHKKFYLAHADNICQSKSHNNKIAKEASLREVDKVIYLNRCETNEAIYYKGRQLTPLSNSINEVIKEGGITEDFSSLLCDFWSDIDFNNTQNEGGVSLPAGKKPELLLYRILKLTTNENNIVMDFHLGSGTTAAVAHKMGMQYIGIEQLDYGDNDSLKRLVNVVNGDNTAISPIVNWKGGGSFIYLELAKNNEQAKEQIMACNSLQELMQLFDELYDKFFLHYNVRAEEFKEKISKEDAFIALPLSRQQEIFCRMLDLNQLYVNVSEMEDSRYNLPAEDIALTKAFYQIAE